MKIKVGVMFGGKSTEHEISIISALQALESMDKDKYDIIPIYITRKGEMYTGDSIGKIEEYTNLKKLLGKSQKIILTENNNRVEIVKYPLQKFGKNILGYIDVVFPIVHGTNVEDGTLQGYLRTLGVPFVGCDVLSAAVSMDKYVMKTILKYEGIPVLDCLIIDTYEYELDSKLVQTKIEKQIPFPVIVKPINLGSSIGIKIAKDKSSLTEALEYAFLFATKVLVEKAIVNIKEINCSVLGDAEEAIASECEEPIASGEILSYENKYTSGSKSKASTGMSSLQRKLPADITAETRKKIREMAVKTFKALGSNGVARIDFIIDYKTEEIWVNEINTIPGSLSFYLWEPVGLKYTDLLNQLIDLAFKRYREEQSITYSFNTSILEGYTSGGLKGSKLNKLN